MKSPQLASQNPEPGTHLVRFRGDTQTFILSLSRPERGTAWLRTNIGHSEITRNEAIKEVRRHTPPLGRDWFDIPMIPIDDGRFRVTIPLCEVGHFEAKSFFLKNNEKKPVWPEGPNVAINVEPADTGCANIIYNAFVRQFGPYKGGEATGQTEANCIQELDNSGFTVIPPSGTFRQLIKELDFIVGELGCRFLQLLPIHPTPTTFARMGRFGSPYAALSFTAVDPALAEFDPRATPLEQFIELVDAVHARNARILIDIAINHTGWAASLHETHPEWLVRDQGGRIEVPGAWGVLWEDLTMLDYNKKDLWRYMADVFLTWCRRGVDGFRCDAGYMIPVSAWKYILAVVRDQYPDTVFLLEGLGGKISVTRDILNRSGFNWAYSELFQNYDRGQIENYLPEAIEISGADGITIHFAETHDNKRLASRSILYAKMRTALCALCSHQGGFGFANGVEWYATEKIDVHGAPSLNWGAEINQVKNIRRLSILLKNHPAFHDRTDLKLVQSGEGNYIALLRHHIPSGKRLLVLANLADETHATGSWEPGKTGMTGPEFIDLLTENIVRIYPAGRQHHIPLEPGQVLCLTEDRNDVDLVNRIESHFCAIPDRIKSQRMRAKALDVLRFYNGTRDLGNFDPDQSARLLEADPVSFCRSQNPLGKESRVILWQWPRDGKREVMVPPNHFLLIRGERPFLARIMDNERCLAQEESLISADGYCFALFSPLAVPTAHISRTLKLSIFKTGGCEHVQAPLLYLSRPEDVNVKTTYHRPELMNNSLLFLGTNNRGGMLRARVHWGALHSKYDALLAGNLSPHFPEDRRVMFTRCRAWLVFQGYSQEICFDCFDSFCFDYNSRGFWRFLVPTGQGDHVKFTASIEMISEDNAVGIRFFRESNDSQAGLLADIEPVELILRPDIEDRNFHETTKAYQGPEQIWLESVTIDPKGFSFSTTPGRRLSLQISRGVFVHEPEWHYMVYHHLEEERGLDPHSDLFSPGYFSTFLTGNDSVELTAVILNEKTRNSFKRSKEPALPVSGGFKDPVALKSGVALRQALDQYVVTRERFHSVIAGYPWFLDWGRDSLIFTRGLIAARKTQTARDILKLFGQFENQGTIPNMIRGKDAGNRDTTDAPLWFFVACSDLTRSKENKDFLDEYCNDRTIRQILLSIGDAFVSGTPNGIRMDPESCLIFSPAHFTWMDTNHPAGTPRQGYPVEIQALWFAALTVLSRIDPGGTKHQWKKMADRVRKSIIKYFMMDELGYLSDCLHAEYGIPAKRAVRDDALRPNQLFAITMGAVIDTAICRRIVSSCEELLIPGAMRSLADRPVRHPLQVWHHGRLMNDPYQPFQGRYQGDEDTQRKPAYHNGTAWTWILPSFCEAWVKTHGDDGKDAAMAWLSSSVHLMNCGCVGHVPEILDGDFPHTPRGCDAQAWGVSELMRVWIQLDGKTKR